MANQEHVKILKQGVGVWNKWREDNLSVRPDLDGINLRNAELIEVNFFFTKLNRANLSNANLHSANFDSTVLVDADLSDTHLVKANLLSTNLRGANLSRANLLSTNFRRARLIGANLESVKLGRTFFWETDLERAKGLKNCRHESPSILDHTTLEKSGELPLEFLRGCGLPDWLIEAAEANIHGAIRFYSCFISYNNQDEEFAKRLHADLQDSGVRCWFAPEDMKIGDKVLTVVQDAIRFHDKLVLILSKDSIYSDWVEHEVSNALEREEKEGKEVLFPIRIDDAVMDCKFGWARRLREAHKPTGRHIGDFTGWKHHDSYTKAFERLLRDLKA